MAEGASAHIIAWRTLLRNVLRRTGQKKDARTIEMMGYSADDLRRHVESLWATTRVIEGVQYEGNLNRIKRWDNA